MVQEWLTRHDLRYSLSRGLYLYNSDRMSIAISLHSWERWKHKVIQQAWWESIWRPKNGIFSGKVRVVLLFQDGQSSNKASIGGVEVFDTYSIRSAWWLMNEGVCMCIDSLHSSRREYLIPSPTQLIHSRYLNFPSPSLYLFHTCITTSQVQSKWHDQHQSKLC